MYNNELTVLRQWFKYRHHITRQYKSKDCDIKTARKTIINSNTYKTKKKNYRLIKRNSQKMNRMDLQKNTRCMIYCRYADDWIILSNCHSFELQVIKQECKNFLNEKLKLELSEEKRKITNISKQEAKFLGYNLFMLTGFNRTMRDFSYYNKLEPEKKIRLNRPEDYNPKIHIKKFTGQFKSRIGAGHISIGVDTE